MPETNPINGISCNCTNCRYHSGTSCCCAPRIQVGTNCAVCSEQTCCDTFQPKK